MRGDDATGAVPAETTEPASAERPNPLSTYWDIGDIQFHCRVGRTRAWQLVKEPSFPAPVAIGSGKFVWPQAEVVTFMEARRQPDRYRQPTTAPERPAEPSPVPYRRREVGRRRRHD